MNKKGLDCKWYIQCGDSSLRESISLNLIDEETNEGVMNFDLYVEDILALLHGGNRRNWAPVDFETTDKILEGTRLSINRGMIGEFDEAEIFGTREVVVEAKRDS